jgi:hypothetical protein
MYAYQKVRSAPASSRKIIVIDLFLLFAIARDLPNGKRQLPVIRAFKSTLEELEQKRLDHSVHSLRSSRSQPGLRPISDVTHSDDSQLLKAASAHQITLDEQEQYYNYDRNQLRPPPDSATYSLTSDGLVTVGGVGGGGDHT